MTEIETHTHKKRRRAPFTMTAFRWASCALLLLSAAVVSVEGSPVTPFLRPNHQTHRREEQKKISNDEKDAPAAVNISKFQLDLVGTFPESLCSHVMLPLVENFLTDYVGDEAESQGMVLETLDLAADTSSSPVSRRTLQEDTMSLTVHGGVAFFSAATDAPTEAELEGTIETGLQKDFPAYLESQVAGTTVTSSTFTSSTLAPTAAPPPAPAPGGIQAPEQSVDESKKRGIIAAGATGAFLGVLIVAAALLVRRHRGPSLDEYLERARGDTIKDNVTHVASSFNGGGGAAADDDDDDDEDEHVGKSSSGETLSSGQRDLQTQDDSSQWTLSTYPEDANTVVTYGTGKSVVTSNMIDRTESFERDRQVSLKKDMLNTSPGWNATDAGNEEMGKKVDDTVLAPSHFVTADEEPPPANTARFAANDEGEEIYLMPPSSKPRGVSFQEAS